MFNRSCVAVSGAAEGLEVELGQFRCVATSIQSCVSFNVGHVTKPNSNAMIPQLTCVRWERVQREDSASEVHLTGSKLNLLDFRTQATSVSLKWS